MNSPPVSKLKSEIAVLEGIIREKKEQLRIAEAIEIAERRSVAKACGGIAAEINHGR